MNKIYAVGVFKIDNGIKCQRLWALYSTFEIAEKVIFNNYYDMFEEQSYNYALIEEVDVLDNEDSFLETYKHQWWYKTNDSGKIIKTKVPDAYRNIVNWFVG